MDENNSHSFYERGSNKHPIGIINRHCGVSETHKVTTEDGYILTLFRIPKKNRKGVILFQHPVGLDCRIWLSQFNESTAFYFWRNGYDVWLGNTRGTTYSKRHVKLSSEDLDFWNYRFKWFLHFFDNVFSFHEIGYFDIDANITLIKSITKEEKIIYVGYSMGATSGLIYASTKDEEAANSVKLFILLAPATHLNSNGSSILKFLVPPFFYLNNRFSFCDVRTRPWKEDTWKLKTVRKILQLLPYRCFIYLSSTLFGWSPNEIDPKLCNNFISIIGSEVPFKLFEHFNQFYIAGGRFLHFDYGPKKNFKIYGNEAPPLYPLQKIKAPVVVIYGEKDSLISPECQQVLIKDLPARCKIFESFEAEGFTHNDFCYGRHRFERVYNKILEILEHT